jgi:hypothetical protein
VENLLGLCLMAIVPTYPPVRQPSVWNAWLLSMQAFRDGFTTSGTFRSPYSYLIDFDGTDYHVVNAYQTVYGGPDDAGGVDGGDVNAVIQAMLDDASAIDVFFNPAVYPITADLVLPERFLSLRGVPWNSIIQPVAGNITMLRYADGASNRDGLILDGLEFDGANQTGGDGAFLYNLTNGIIRNCQFIDVYGFGLFTSPDTDVDGTPKAGRVSSDLLVFNNDFDNCGRGAANDMYGGGWFDNSIIAFNRFKDSKGCSLDHVGSEHSLYFGNKFKLEDVGYQAAGPSIFVSDGGMNCNVISHNTFSALGDRAAIYLASSFGGVADFGAPTYNQIVDNVIDGCSAAIQVVSAAGGTQPFGNLVSRNRIRDATYAIYMLDALDSEVSGNQITDWNKNSSGVTLQQIAIVIDNALYGTENVTVRDNKLSMIEARTTRGIYVYATAQDAVNMRVFDNDLAAATYPLSYGEGGGHTVTWARVNGNVGDKTDNCGLTAAAASPIEVAHGLSGIPISIIVSPVSASVTPNVADVDEDSFSITWGEGGNIAFYWQAKKTV